jgi:hypothetical protein
MGTKLQGRLGDLEEAVGGLQGTEALEDLEGTWGEWVEGGGAGGFSVQGTETLYYGVFLRAYNPATGELRAIGAEQVGDDLKPTWDVLRAT